MMSEWQPIETAPKDGSQFQVWISEDGSGSAYWEPRARFNAENGTLEIYGEIYGDWGWYAIEAGNPTHWMTSPKPPVLGSSQIANPLGGDADNVPTMIERVARAVYRPQFGGPWGQAAPFLRKVYLSDARIMIEQMREPTEAMINAGIAADWVGIDEGRAGYALLPDTLNTYEADEKGDDIVINRPGIWKAMIDAALAEDTHG